MYYVIRIARYLVSYGLSWVIANYGQEIMEFINDYVLYYFPEVEQYLR